MASEIRTLKDLLEYFVTLSRIIIIIIIKNKIKNKNKK